MPTKSGIIWQGGQTVLNLNGIDESLTFKKGLIPSSGNFTVSVIFRAGTFASPYTELLS